jgi:undecaprenyl-diphosphatase
VPVSSSAQLVLLPWLLGWEQPADRTTFAAGLHAGSCLGIGWALRSELRRLSAREVVVLGAVSVPAAVAGLLAADAVEERLGRPPQLAALLAGFGALMWAVDAVAAGRPRAAPSAVADGEAALAALAQVVALVPGVSRSGATLTALRAAGVDRAAAERFSLLMSLPVTAGAAGLTLAGADRAALRAMAPALAAGTATAAVAGAAAATRLTARPGRPLTAAALYRLGLAAGVAARLVRKGDT